MPIAGITDRITQRDMQQGRSVRLGVLGKGRKIGHGREVKLVDEDYFVFRPARGDETLGKLFYEAYGSRPTVISDVRIPVDMAGNFEIEECAWLTAAQHRKNGSVFLARSDGKWIRQARLEETGRVVNYAEGELEQDKMTAVDPKTGKEGYRYQDKVYPWQQSLAIDLLLPDFNRLVFQEDIAGYGVVTLTTHSTYDISNLIREYYGIINELASMFSNPMKPGDQDMARRYLPIRNFPLRLYRAHDAITTPNWQRDGNPADRMTGTRSLLHWTLAPEAAAAIQIAIDRRTTNMLTAVAQAPMLERTVGDINADLFGDAGEPRAIPERTGFQPPNWDEVLDQPEDAGDEIEDAEFEDEIVVAEVDEVVEEQAEEIAEPAVEPDSKVVDLWSSVEEKMTRKEGFAPSVDLGEIADALIKANERFTGRRDVWNWLNSKANKDLRDAGLKVFHTTVVTKKGARTVFDRGVAYDGTNS